MATLEITGTIKLDPETLLAIGSLETAIRELSIQIQGTRLVTPIAADVERAESQFTAPPPREKPSPAVWYTEERKAKLRAMYPDKRVTPADIVKALVALPGPALPKWGTIQTYAIQSLGVRRTEETGPSRLSQAMTMPTGAIDISKPIPVDFPTARAKASLWGVDFNTWNDLAVLNQHAMRIGHPQFVRE